MNISRIMTGMFLFPMWVHELEDSSGTRHAQSFYDDISSRRRCSRRRSGLIIMTKEMKDRGYVVSSTNQTRFLIEDDPLFRVGCLAIKTSFACLYRHDRVDLNVALVKRFR